MAEEHSKIEECLGLALQIGRATRSMTSECPGGTIWPLSMDLKEDMHPEDDCELTEEQRLILENLKKDLMAKDSPHSQHDQGCVCTITDLVPLPPRNLYHPTLAVLDDQRDWGLAMCEELLDMTRILSFYSPEDFLPLFHDACYRAIQQRLGAIGQSELPWTLLADLRNCKGDVLRSLGFRDEAVARFAWKLVGPTEHRARKIGIFYEDAVDGRELRVDADGGDVNLQLPIDLAQTFSLLEVWNQLHEIVGSDYSAHTLDPVYGCSCLNHRGVEHDEGSTVASWNISFFEATRLFPNLLNYSRTQLIPHIERLLEVAPLDEFLPVLHKMIQRIMRKRVGDGKHKVACNYLLRVEDLRICEAEWLRTMGFSSYQEAKEVMKDVDASK